MKSAGYSVQNIILQDEELNLAIENYNRTLPRGKQYLKVVYWTDLTKVLIDMYDMYYVNVDREFIKSIKRKFEVIFPVQV